ncbi:hypothetical protein Leryth_012515 [Lithospermum erythrorhizon]|nr:hypothetical protein Leryth_012515 [Lithospermum erythrorhizon]
MGSKFPHILCLILLIISIYSLFYHEFCTLKKLNNVDTKTSYYASTLTHHPPPPPLVYRKELSIKFDLTPFINKKRHHHRKHLPEAHRPPPVYKEIDPRYGVEKRLVPTGPNPLHH